MVDCINFYMHDKCADLASISRIPAGKLFVYHLNDCEDLPFGVLDHCHRIMPGQGCIPIADISRAVQDAGYSGTLGKPHVVKVCSRDPDHQSMDYIKTSGGIFLDMTIHDFDMVRYLSCGEVTEVCAYGAVCSDAPYGDYDDIDTAIIMLKFDNGALGIIDNSRASHYGYDQRTKVQCDRGCVRVDNDLENTAQIASADGVSIAKPTWFFLERYNNAFIAESRAFCDAVLKNTPVPVNGRDGLMPVAIAMAAAKSYRENRSVLLSEILG